MADVDVRVQERVSWSCFSLVQGSVVPFLMGVRFRSGVGCRIRGSERAVGSRHHSKEPSCVYNKAS